MPEELASESQPRSSKIVESARFLQRVIRPKDAIIDKPREVSTANIANDIVRDRIQFRQQGRIINQEQQLAAARAELEQAQEESMTDALTGLHNRRWYNSELQKSIAEIQRSGGTLALANIDFDNFKLYNEVFGHTTGGDPALQSIANLPFRKDAPIARIGGDEFGQIVKGITPAELTVLSTRYLERTVEMGHLLFDKAPKDESKYKAPENMTLSIGWALYEGESQEEFERKTDLAEAEAKRLGKACAVLAIKGAQGYEFIRLTNPIEDQSEDDLQMAA